MPTKTWDYSHDPAKKPLGCNGKYGQSGYRGHKKAGTEVCLPCSASKSHYQRERRRGQLHPRTLRPCGTHAAAVRHRRNKEPVDFACLVAQANYKVERRKLTSKNT